MKAKVAVVLSFTAIVLSVAAATSWKSAMADDTATQVAAQAKQVLTTNCIKCHGGTAVNPPGTKGHVDYILNTAQLIAKGKIKPGDPAHSRLYQRLINDPSLDDVDGPMPPDGQSQRPSAADIETIRKWIEIGAPAF